MIILREKIFFLGKNGEAITGQELHDYARKANIDDYVQSYGAMSNPYQRGGLLKERLDELKEKRNDLHNSEESFRKLNSEINRLEHSGSRIPRPKRLKLSDLKYDIEDAKDALSGGVKDEGYYDKLERKLQMKADWDKIDKDYLRDVYGDKESRRIDKQDKLYKKYDKSIKVEKKNHSLTKEELDKVVEDLIKKNPKLRSNFSVNRDADGNFFSGSRGKKLNNILEEIYKTEDEGHLNSLRNELEGYLDNNKLSISLNKDATRATVEHEKGHLLNFLNRTDVALGKVKPVKWDNPSQYIETRPDGTKVLKVLPTWFDNGSLKYNRSLSWGDDVSEIHKDDNRIVKAGAQGHVNRLTDVVMGLENVRREERDATAKAIKNMYLDPTVPIEDLDAAHKHLKLAGDTYGYTNQKRGLIAGSSERGIMYGESKLRALEKEEDGLISKLIKEGRPVNEIVNKVHKFRKGTLHATGSKSDIAKKILSMVKK